MHLLTVIGKTMIVYVISIPISFVLGWVLFDRMSRGPDINALACAVAYPPIAALVYFIGKI